MMRGKEVMRAVFEYLDNATGKVSWKDFHKQYPDIEKWEYEWGCKRYQEM